MRMIHSCLLHIVLESEIKNTLMQEHVYVDSNSLKMSKIYTDYYYCYFNLIMSGDRKLYLIFPQRKQFYKYPYFKNLVCYCPL